MFKYFLPLFVLATFDFHCQRVKTLDSKGIVKNGFIDLSGSNNGSVFANNGMVDSTPKNYQPHWVSNTLLLPNKVDTLKLILQVANFSHAKGGIAGSYFALG